MAEKHIAKIISVVFHPLLVCMLGLFLMFNSGSSLSVIQPRVKNITLIISAIFTLVFPLGMMISLYLTKIIKDFHLENNKDRTLPLVVIMIMYLFVFFIVRRIPQLDHAHVSFFLGAVVALVFALVFNTYSTPSIHMLGMGLLTGMLLVIIIFYRAPVQWFFIVAVLASGMTGTARLLTGHHTFGEISAGYITGFLSAATVMLLYQLT